MATVEIYTSPFCGFCARAKALLERKGVPFTEYDVMMSPGKRREMQERSGGGTTVPQVFVDGRLIGGADELAALDRDGALDDLLGLDQRDPVKPPFRVACVQTNSARDVAPNLEMVSRLVDEAAAGGAAFVLLPENVAMLEPDTRLQWEKAAPEPDHPAVAMCSQLAARHQIWLLAGSVSIRLDAGKLANRSLLYDPAGAIIARYDKIHLFDVELDQGESYRESATIAPGSRSVLATLPWGRLGMTICYDLRFPHLYRHLAKAGADFLAIPAAFTRVTGVAHWHVLQRARAIETGCYVFAPAQCGEHANGRQTYGHSLIVNPWGEILADGGEAVGIISADIDPAEVAAARHRIPALTHDRPFD